jgi:hypothetical protein
MVMCECNCRSLFFPGEAGMSFRVSRPASLYVEPPLAAESGVLVNLEPWETSFEV